jgi:glutamine synthetase
MVHCDPHVAGQPWPYAPRNILRSVLGRLADQGLSSQVGAEAEYFLVRRDAEGKLAVADERDRSARPCYDARDLTRMYEHLTEVSIAINGLGWSNYANDHEDGNDRTHLIRVPDGDRIEVRACDGSANPYLAMAALLTAGMDGIGRGLDPGERGAGAGQPLPPTLLHAVQGLAADEVVSDCLDAAAGSGHQVAEYYRQVKTEEFLTWHSQVSAWETDRYLTAF